jgi:hypothetical protein
LPSGQLEWLKLSPPPTGGAVGVGWGATVVGGVDDEGEPPPQDDVRKARVAAADTAVAATPFRDKGIGVFIILYEAHTDGSKENSTAPNPGRQALSGPGHKL